MILMISQAYDPTIETNHYESKGTYTVEIVGEKRRQLRLRRSSAGTDLSEAVENSLLAFIKCYYERLLLMKVLNIMILYTVALLS